jgi:hypothetical protein
MKRDGELWRFSRLRPVKYLNNIVEQDHRRIKRLVRPGLGFGSLPTARRTLAGYEGMAMIRKGQVRTIGGGRYAGSGRLRRHPVRDCGLIWALPRRFLSRPPTLQQIRTSDARGGLAPSPRPSARKLQAAPDTCVKRSTVQAARERLSTSVHDPVRPQVAGGQALARIARGPDGDENLPVGVWARQVEGAHSFDCLN